MLDIWVAVVEFCTPSEIELYLRHTTDFNELTAAILLHWYGGTLITSYDDLWPCFQAWREFQRYLSGKMSLTARYVPLRLLYQWSGGYSCTQGLQESRTIVKGFSLAVLREIVVNREETCDTMSSPSSSSFWTKHGSHAWRARMQQQLLLVRHRWQCAVEEVAKTSPYWERFLIFRNDRKVLLGMCSIDTRLAELTQRYQIIHDPHRRRIKRRRTQERAFQRLL